jgi:hypothetical protein
MKKESNIWKNYDSSVISIPEIIDLNLNMKHIQMNPE